MMLSCLHGHVTAGRSPPTALWYHVTKLSILSYLLLVNPYLRAAALASEGAAKRVQIPAWLQQEMESMPASTKDSADVRAKWVKPVDQLKPDPHLDKQIAKAKMAAARGGRGGAVSADRSHGAGGGGGASPTKVRPKSAKFRERPQNLRTAAGVPPQFARLRDPQGLMETWLEEQERVNALVRQDFVDGGVQTSEEVGIQTEKEYVAPAALDRVPSPVTVLDGDKKVYKVRRISFSENRFLGSGPGGDRRGR